MPGQPRLVPGGSNISVGALERANGNIRRRIIQKQKLKGFSRFTIQDSGLIRKVTGLSIHS
jgi:hypothetical protein